MRLDAVLVHAGFQPENDVSDAGQEADRCGGIEPTSLTIRRRDAGVSLPAAHLGAAHRHGPKPELETLYRYEDTGVRPFQGLQNVSIKGKGYLSVIGILSPPRVR